MRVDLDEFFSKLSSWEGGWRAGTAAAAATAPFLRILGSEMEAILLYGVGNV